MYYNVIEFVLVYFYTIITGSFGTYQFSHSEAQTWRVCEV